MTQKLIDKDTDKDIELDDSEIGRMYLFWVPTEPDHHTFSFASKLEDIGILKKQTCIIKNKTQVLVLSEPLEINHPKYGPMLINRILAHQIMWVRSDALIPIDINKNQ